MNRQVNPYESYPAATSAPVAAMASEGERAEFIRRTYGHLAGAIIGFVVLECMVFMFTTPDTRIQLVRRMMGTPMTWLLVLGAFIGVSFLANKWANSSTSLSTQYWGLTLYVIAEAAIFAPMLFLADPYAPGAIASAAIVTLVVFGGLTGYVFVTGADFSGWGKYLSIAAFAALGFIVFAAFFPSQIGLGSIFSGFMIMLASAYILYDTSNVLHNYRTTQHVAASLALFASVALLFWYVLRIMMELSRD